MKNKYDIIYSIGHDCACSMYLRKHNLRTTSGPFDWLTNVSPKKRFELMLNEFDDFMNIDDFEFMQKNPEIFNDDACDYYKNKKNGFYFYHDFPTGVPLQESFPDVAKKYERRIKRFYENIKNKERVLLVWFSHYHETPNDEWNDFALKFCNKIDKNIDFLIIQHRDGQYLPNVTQIAPNVIRYDVHTIEKDKDGNITTVGNERLCSPIFDKYALRIPKGNVLPYLYKMFLLRTVCKYTPIKKLRHVWRDKLTNDINMLKNAD